MNLDKVKLALTPFGKNIVLFRHGKDPNLALEKRDAEQDVMAVILEWMIDNPLGDNAKGTRRNFSFGGKCFELRVQPTESLNSEPPEKIKNKLFLEEFDKDYSEESDKPLLVPKNNREYWLFTEIHQRLQDYFKL